MSNLPADKDVAEAADAVATPVQQLRWPLIVLFIALGALAVAVAINWSQVDQLRNPTPQEQHAGIDKAIGTVTPEQACRIVRKAGIQCHLRHPRHPRAQYAHSRRKQVEQHGHAAGTPRHVAQSKDGP